MKIKLFAVMLAVFAVCSAASAQNYTIRVDNNTNLRSCAATNCDVVDTAPAGAILHVTGQLNRWLRVSRIGIELWMADWVNYTRVENSEQPQTSSPPASSAPANIDNCCFVDRQCHTDEEWTSGYWAYQNNQCAAPATSPIDTAPAGNGSEIIIEGSPDWKRRVNEALNQIRTRAPQWHAYVTSATNRIIELFWGDSEHYPCPGMACVDLAVKTVHISKFAVFSTFEDYQNQIFKLAGILVHEACHVYQYEEGIINYLTVERREVTCHLVELTALNAMNAPDSVKNNVRVIIRFYGN